jgi:hypothetical protein
MGDSKTLAGNVGKGGGVGVAVDVGVGVAVPVGGCALGDGVGVGVSVSGAGVNVVVSFGVDARPGSTPAGKEGAAVASSGVASPGDCASEVEGW